MMMMRVIWYPFGLMFRAVAWVMLPPVGWMLTRRRRNASRHRQAVAAHDEALRHLRAAASYRPHGWGP